jgi:transcriptional regulator with XRE-family HTH domain
MEDGSSGRLRELRDGAGYSTRDVVRGTGIAKSTYERRELNPGSLILSEMRALAAFYEMPLWEFAQTLGGESAEPERRGGAAA